MKLSRYCVVTQAFFDEKDGQSKRLIFATRSGGVYLISEAGWRTIESGRLDLLSSECVSDLIRAELLVPSDEDELATVLSRNNNAAEDNEGNLAMVIQPTAFCQLGCGYCGQEHTYKWLSADHQDQFLEQVRTKLALKIFHRLAISWFGAEPLSGISVIRSLSPRLQALASEFGCTYGASIVTNGLALTEKVATELVNHHAVRSITVSLDGTAEFHDSRRPTKAGLGTFDRIFSNVVALARRSDLDVQIKIRSNVDRRNAEGVVPLLRMLAEAGVQKRIRFYVAPIHSWGNDAHSLSLSHEAFGAWELQWFCEMVRLGFSLGVIPSLKPVVCLAVQPHGILVDAMGTLFNCTEVSYVPAYGSPNKFSIGSMSTGEVNGKRDLLGSFNARVAAGEYPCAACRMLPVCGGACPKAWMEGEEPCPSAKYNIEERLLLAYAISRIPEPPPSGMTWEPATFATSGPGFELDEAAPAPEAPVYRASELINIRTSVASPRAVS